MQVLMGESSFSDIFFQRWFRIAWQLTGAKTCSKHLWAPMVKDTSADDDEVRFVHCNVGKFRVIIWSDAHRSWKFIIGNVLCCYGPTGAKIGPHLYYLETALRSWWIGKVWNHHFKIAWQSIRCSKNLIKPSRLLIMFYFDSISFLQWGSMVLTPCRVSNKPSLSLLPLHTKPHN